MKVWVNVENNCLIKDIIITFMWVSKPSLHTKPRERMLVKKMLLTFFFFTDFSGRLTSRGGLVMVVRMCKCVRMYVWMLGCEWLCVWICKDVSVCVCVCGCGYVRMWVCVWMWICKGVSVCVWACKCLCVWMCVSVSLSWLGNKSGDELSYSNKAWMRVLRQHTRLI